MIPLPGYRPIVFILSFVIGVLLCVSLFQGHEESQKPVAHVYPRASHHERYEHWLASNQLQLLTAAHGNSTLRPRLVKEAEYLKSRSKVLCWAMIDDTSDLKAAATAIVETWGRRCHKTLLFSSTKISEVPTINVRGDPKSWTSLIEVLRIIQQRYLKNYDWFLKVEGDTYVIMENLLYFLAVYKPSSLLYFGHAYRDWIYSSYNSGESGYVLSKGAVVKLVEALDGQVCSEHDTGPEDIVLGRCLAKLGITSEDTRDELKRGRFLYFPPESLLTPGRVHWGHQFWMKSKFRIKDCKCQYPVLNIYYAIQTPGTCITSWAKHMP